MADATTAEWRQSRAAAVAPIWPEYRCDGGGGIGFLSCREWKGDFSCLTAAGICEASTSDAVGSGSRHGNAGSPCPISNSCAIRTSQWGPKPARLLWVL
uniref:Uncharacterized protein n=1 Tax=Oryza nivara TaxID=4536 RepID=A0A0E0HJH0_ORYNI